MSAPHMHQPGPEQVSFLPIFETTFNFAQTRVLATAVRLDLFTLIKQGATTLAELSAKSQCDTRGLRILLNALVAMKYLQKSGEQYEVSPVASTFLSKDSPQYLGEFTSFDEHPTVRRNWDRLAEIVRTGHPPRAVEGDEDKGEFFAGLVHSLYVANRPAADVAASTLCEGRQNGLRVLDIGAGSGVWGLAIARIDPEARVTVADWPVVIEKATKDFVSLERAAERYEYLAGDFHDVDFGESRFDVALLGHICHSEGAEGTQKLFARIHRALKPDGQLLIAEMIPDEERSAGLMPLIFAVNMLANTEEGDTFTLSEYRQWLQAAGFGEFRTIEAPAPSPLILAKK